MKKPDGTLTYRHSFFYQLIIRFVFMILLPILISWWLYVRVLDYYYDKNTLATQQINMENSLSWLDSSLNAASHVFTALGSNAEIVYYLEYYPDKPSMLYSLIKNVRSFCNNLYMMTPYLAGLNIYSDDPDLLYSAPFAKLSDIPLDAGTLRLLEESGPQEIIWQVSVPEDSGFPAICGYRKLYLADYIKCIGYMEVQLSDRLFSDYFDLLSELGGDTEAAYFLYQGEELIYTSSVQTDPNPSGAHSAVTDPAGFPKPGNSQASGYEIHPLQNECTNTILIPQLGLCVIRSGKLSGLYAGSSERLPSILISLIILLLLSLFFWFFGHVASLSRRILVFSSFIRNSDPDNLTSFHPDFPARQETDELNTLIDAYNTMIHENTALISRVHKMELLSQDARYQALQGQIHPHFIYGTLETIRMTALQNKDREAASMIFSLSTLIRYSISISSKSVTLKDELEIASHYLTIQKIRFDDRMDYDFRTDETLLDLELPSFLLQPLLKNAVMYGISQTLEHCIINVSSERQGSDIILSVFNTGLPVPRQRLLEINSLLSGDTPIESFQGRHNGMALYNIRERLIIFFHGQASIRLASSENGTAAIITIRKEAENASNYDS